MIRSVNELQIPKAALIHQYEKGALGKGNNNIGSFSTNESTPVIHDLKNKKKKILMANLYIILL